MSRRIIRHPTVTGTIALLIAAAGLAGCGSSQKASSSSASKPTTTKPAAAKPPSTSPAASGAGTVPVTLTEYTIKPAASSARAGRVEFVVTNSGKIKHQFTVIKTTKPASSVLSKQNPNDDIPGSKGEIASIAPGASKKLVIQSLKAGHYAIVCALPGHYQSGMYTDFTVN